MTEYETLIVESAEEILWVTLNRPKANAFDGQMIRELLDVLKMAGKDEGTRCLVLTGRGRIFSAGQDIGALGGDSGPLRFRSHLQKTYNRLIPALRGLEKPILGSINGPVAGAGLGVALATDIRVAAESARFVFGFTGIGLTADSGTSLTLPTLVGLARASEMAFLNEPLSATEALHVGLVNEVVSDDRMMEVSQEWAEKLAAGPTRAIGLTKRAFNRALYPGLATTLDYEAHLQEIAAQSDDHVEGVLAFQEKRPPQFMGV